MTHVDEQEKSDQLALWFYLLGDLLLFAVFFTTYRIFHHHTWNGPIPAEVVNISQGWRQTLLLTAGSIACRYGVYHIQRLSRRDTFISFLSCFLFAALFLSHEVQEVSGWLAYPGERSAFLSSLIGIISLHGLHLLGALFLLAILMVKMVYHPMAHSVHGAKLFSLYWTFLELVWGIIFVVVYLFDGV